MDWYDGYRLTEEQCGALISSRWCCWCGMHTRVYLLADGTLLFSHDYLYYSGAHLVAFDTQTTRRLQELWRRRSGRRDCRNDALEAFIERLPGRLHY